mmetsp:Transcript_78744/g.139133  ORF Transcript_78744/g.139133 Transcript_78744/m.139133 type:complete len:273 (-) Transcript_78744:575-1393(-)
MKEAMCGRVLSGPEFRLPQVVISSPTGRSTNLKKSQPPGQGCSWESPPKRPNHPMSGRGPRNTSSSGLALSLNQDFRYLRFGVTSQRNAVHSGSAINATSSFDRNVTHSDRVMHWWPYGSMRLSNSEHSVSVLRGSNTFSIPLNPASSRTPFRSMSNCRNMATNFARKRSCPANWKSRSTFKKIHVRDCALVLQTHRMVDRPGRVLHNDLPDTNDDTDRVLGVEHVLDDPNPLILIDLGMDFLLQQRIHFRLRLQRMPPLQVHPQQFVHRLL